VAVSCRGRAEYSAFNAVAHFFQWSDEGGELAGGIPRHVLTEETERPCAVDDAQHLVDEETFVVGAEPLAGIAVGLAGIAGSDAMNASTPRVRVEGGKVRPDRRGSQVTRFHARDQSCGGSGFPLHVSDATRSGHGELDTEAEPAGAGAQFDDVPGT
jgi:hypothetical protein